MEKKKQKEKEQTPRYSHICPSAIRRVAETYLTNPDDLDDLDDLDDFMDSMGQLDKAFKYLYLYSSEGNKTQDCLAMAIRHITNLMKVEEICKDVEDSREEAEQELAEQEVDDANIEDQYAIDGQVPIELDGDDFNISDDHGTTNKTTKPSACCGNCQGLNVCDKEEIEGGK